MGSGSSIAYSAQGFPLFSKLVIYERAHFAIRSIARDKVAGVL